MERAIDVGIGCVDNRMIDRINIYEAARVAMKQAVESLRIKPEQLLIDAMQIETDIPQKNLSKEMPNLPLFQPQALLPR